MDTTKNIIVAETATQTETSMTMSNTNPKALVYSALAKAQAEFATPRKDARYNYGRYATLSGCLESVKPALNKYGLFLSQIVEPIDARNLRIKTIIFHDSGESLELGSIIVSIDAGGRMNSNQAAGSAITYGRRYSLCAALGISAVEDDDDGNASGQGSAGEHYANRNTPQAKAPSVSQEQIDALVTEWTEKFISCSTPEELTEVAGGVQKLPKPARDQLVAVYKTEKKRINAALDKALAEQEKA